MRIDFFWTIIILERYRFLVSHMTRNHLDQNILHFAAVLTSHTLGQWHTLRALRAIGPL